jgi:hypothetical protein
VETSSQRLELKLKDSALMVLRRHGIGEDELQLEESEPGKPPSCLIRGHRVRVQIDDRSAAFRVHAGRWSGARVDFPTVGAFIAAFEEALQGALSGQE